MDVDDIIVQLRMKYVEDLEDILQCPICWEIPTNLTVFTCSEGHHICETCKTNYPLFNCPTCQSDFNGSRNYIAEEISTKFEDMKSSLLQPNHYLNRRIEKRHVYTQTEKATTVSADTQTVTESVVQVTRETECDLDNEQELEQSFETDLKNSSESSSEDEVESEQEYCCILESCKETCLKNEIVAHIETKHQDCIFQIPALDDDIYSDTWFVPELKNVSKDFIVNITEVGMLHLSVLIDDQGLHGNIQMITSNDSNLQLRYVLSVQKNELIYEPFKGTVKEFSTVDLEAEKIFVGSQFLNKFMTQDTKKYALRLTLYRTSTTD